LETIPLNLPYRPSAIRGIGDVHMLEGLRAWAGGAAGAGTEVCPAALDGVDDDRRQGGDRVRMPGAEVFLFLEGDQRYRCGFGISA
jgi:hypothetical protein